MEYTEKMTSRRIANLAKYDKEKAIELARANGFDFLAARLVSGWTAQELSRVSKISTSDIARMGRNQKVSQSVLDRAYQTMGVKPKVKKETPKPQGNGRFYLIDKKDQMIMPLTGFQCDILAMIFADTP